MPCCTTFLTCLPVIFFLFVYCWSYYVYVAVLCTYLIKSVAKKTTHLIVYHIISIMAIISYFAAMCIKNKVVPRNYRLSTAEYEKLKLAETENVKNRLLESFCKVKNIKVYTVTNSGGIR